MAQWSVTADDRTGALEMAGFLARPGVPAVLSVFPDLGGDVVDLGSRSLDAAGAAARAGEVPGGAWDAHKIDSTLRGNWAAEVHARCRATGRAAVIVAAWPAMGRTCTGGVVRVGGAVVGALADSLPGTVSLPDAAALGTWLAAEGSEGVDGGPIAAVDVADDEALGAVAGIVGRSAALAVGPAGALGAVHAARLGDAAPAHVPAAVPEARRVRSAAGVLVVCASATGLAAQQLEAVRRAWPATAVVAAPRAEGVGLDPRVAAQVAAAARRLGAGFGAVVVVVGDTAAAFLGGGRRLVGGFAMPGMPWSLDASGGGPLVVTKAGGFGDSDSLVRLIDLLAA